MGVGTGFILEPARIFVGLDLGQSQDPSGKASQKAKVKRQKAKVFRAAHVDEGSFVRWELERDSFWSRRGSLSGWILGRARILRERQVKRQKSKGKRQKCFGRHMSMKGAS